MTPNPRVIVLTIIVTVLAGLAFPFWLRSVSLIYDVVMIWPFLFIPACVGGAASGLAIGWYYFEYLPTQEAGAQ